MTPAPHGEALKEMLRLVALRVKYLAMSTIEYEQYNKGKSHSKERGKEAIEIMFCLHMHH